MSNYLPTVVGENLMDAVDDHIMHDLREGQECDPT